jgi:asparagine N-glycosylation enzyme membrane subunit Stt3
MGTTDSRLDTIDSKLRTPPAEKRLLVRWSSLTAPLLLLVICCGFYWRLILSREYTWLDSPDLVRMEAPRFQFQASQWHLRRFPLWDPHQWCGQPFLGQIVGAANPLNWPFFRLPLSESGKISLDVMHWYFVLIHFLGGLFAYWLCREAQRSRTASLAGAIIFALSGFFSSAPWPEVMGGYIWTPLVFLFLLRTLRGRRPVSSAALCGLFLGAAWLSGHHEVPIYLSFTVAGCWLYYIISEPTRRVRMLRLAAIALLLTVLTSGFQTLPG